MFTSTPYSIIQETYGHNVKISNLTDGIRSKSHANKVSLSVYESNRNDIESALGVFHSISRTTIEQFNEELLRLSAKHFSAYIEKTSSYASYLILQGNKDNTKRITIPIFNRYSSDYRNEVKKRMDWVIYRYRNASAVLLVLTIDPKKYGYDKYLMWINIKKEVNRFLTDLRYYFKLRGLPFPKYIDTIEAQKGRVETDFIAKGNPHIHMVFLGCKRLLDWRKIRDLWGLGHCYINRTTEGQKVRYPINYITKYITKTFTETNKDNCLTQSLCWLFNIRSFSTSRGLVYPLSCSGTDWEPLLLVCIKKTMNSFQILSQIDVLFFSVLKERDNEYKEILERLAKLELVLLEILAEEKSLYEGFLNEKTFCI